MIRAVRRRRKTRWRVRRSAVERDRAPLAVVGVVEGARRDGVRADGLLQGDARYVYERPLIPLSEFALESQK